MRKVYIAVFVAVFLVSLSILSGISFHTVPVGDGDTVLVYHQSVKPLGGGSVASDLVQQLAVVHSGENTILEQYHGLWQDRQIAVWDTVIYNLSDLGCGLDGGIYIQCSAAITRTAADEATGQIIGCTQRTCTYTGYDDDDLSSTARARVLWDTLLYKLFQS